MHELKDSMQKMTTESQYLGSSMREIKEMLPKSCDKLDSLSTPKLDEQKTSSHTREKSDQSTRFKTTIHDQPQPTKLDFPKYSGDDPTIWLDHAMQYFNYQRTSEDCKVTLVAFIWMGMWTNGGSRWRRCIARRRLKSHRKIFRRICWSNLGQLRQRILMRLCLEYVKVGHLGTSNESLRDLLIGLMAALKMH